MNFTQKITKKISFPPPIILIAFIFIACSKKNYPVNTPFVYNNNIELVGNITKDEKKRLNAELSNYWADSLKPRHTSLWLGLYKKFDNPPIFDTSNFDRSRIYMNAYLQSQGYYYATFGKDSFYIKKGPKIGKKKQLRTTAIMTIYLGKGIKIDTLSYNFVDTPFNTHKDTLLQQLALQKFNSSYLQKGTPYTKQKISDELDRLVNWFRENGYYKFTREHIYALVDTTNDNLFKLTLDPIELANLIAEAEKKRKENPAWKIAIKQRETDDTTKLNKFYVRDIFFYPDTKIADIPDTLINYAWQHTLQNKRGDLHVNFKHYLFKLRPLREHSFLRGGSLYNEYDYFKTLNTLSSIPAWQQVDARIIQQGNDSLDIHYFLVPEKKYQINYNIESSRNSGDFTAGNLLGVSLSTSLSNRNVAKVAIQSNTNLRGGIELNLFKQNGQNTQSDLIQTFQFSLSHTYSFPRLLMPRPMLRLPIIRKSENRRTIISGAVAYTERFKIFRLRSANFNFGWEWQKATRKKHNAVYLWKPLNIELYSIDTLPGLKTLFDANPFLRNSFNTGNVIGFPFPGGGLNYTLTKPGKKPNSNTQFRWGIEESGLLTLPFKSLKNQVYQYVKGEVEYKYAQQRPKSEFAYRLFAGIGVPLSGQSLPFFKQYFAGGPNSMRAWGLRQLGLGSSILSDTIAANSFRDRFGDMQLEANFEYRFTLASIKSFKIGSALFADIGNVWNVKKDALNSNAEFSLNRLYNDIAIGIGTGLRLDFSLFLIRIDFAYKVKDPGRFTNNGWMSFKDFTWSEYRNNQTHTQVKNYAIQLGIGLPF
ncbi:MAG: BamA/TamA family outer membrane protein [Chitinophagaceae bacterium]|nr:BamA/TamA family outer membrane protein [Chitinophagaceae bacterium]MCW5905847.1 BamA/TamA family outer membrane protein [Chitinophagaceae bacterium]